MLNGPELGTPEGDASVKRYLDLAARLAARAQGYVEPNPMVGCVIVRREADGSGRVIGLGHHERFGGAHAETIALRDCVNRGENPAGAEFYVTLEPCNGRGQQPPCADMLLGVRPSKVVCARRDPNPAKAGGAERLRAAGIPVEFTTISEHATALSDAFVKRLTTGQPWVIVKWAQTIDGRAATRTGESKWISGERSRRRVHGLRAKVDAILTAIGTVQADNPTLTARGGWLRRRTARRVIIDPDLELSDDSAIMQTLDEAPLTLVCADEALTQRAQRVSVLTGKGVEIVALGSGGEIDLGAALRHLSERHQATNVLVEAGPGLTGRLLEFDLVDELHVYTAPMVLADEQAKPVARGRTALALLDGKRYTLSRVKRIDDDVWTVYRRVMAV